MMRTVYINNIRSLFEHSSYNINILLDDPASCTQVLLDPRYPDTDTILTLNSEQTRRLELYSRELIIKIQLERTKIVNCKITRNHLNMNEQCK